MKKDITEHLEELIYALKCINYKVVKCDNKGCTNEACPMRRG